MGRPVVDRLAKGQRAEIKMGRQPRSGDFPWLSAHSILNWIGGDTSMLDPCAQMSSILSFFFNGLLSNFRSGNPACSR
jgi:hypothetical protein